MTGVQTCALPIYEEVEAMADDAQRDERERLHLEDDREEDERKRRRAKVPLLSAVAIADSAPSSAASRCSNMSTVGFVKRE